MNKKCSKIQFGVKLDHPLAELVAKKLSGIEIVPNKEKGRMVNAAAMAAVKWHKKEIIELELELNASCNRIQVALDHYFIADDLCRRDLEKQLRYNKKLLNKEK